MGEGGALLFAVFGRVLVGVEAIDEAGGEKVLFLEDGQHVVGHDFPVGGGEAGVFQGEELGDAGARLSAVGASGEELVGLAGDIIDDGAEVHGGDARAKVGGNAGNYTGFLQR